MKTNYNKFDKAYYKGPAIGPFQGKNCCCLVTILNMVPNLDGYYKISAVFAHNVLAVPTIVHERHLHKTYR